MNDFAKSQLLKYGWTEGKGLGKHENGIIEALKPKLKFDTAGVGHKDANWYNWWEAAFNKAANSINVDSQIHNVSVSVSNKNTTSNLSENLNKKKSESLVNYEKFLKTSTLLNGNLITENNPNVSKVEDVTHVSLTDDELFKICGGRTAHKGARHGLTLNGKLNRIAQQEKDLLNVDAYRNMAGKLENNNNKSHSDEYKSDNNNESILLPTYLVNEEPIVPASISKTARKKNRKRINNLTHQLNVLCNLSDDNHEKGKEIKVEEREKSKKCKRKKKRSSISDDVEGTDNVSDDLSSAVSKKLGKKMKRKIQEHTNDNPRYNLNEEFKHKKKKKRSKKKNQDYQHICISDAWEDEEMDGFKAKKLKKSESSDFTLQLHDCDETSAHSNQTSDSGMCVSERTSNLSHEYIKNQADQLNAKIRKKKRSKHRRQRRKLHKITASLQAVHFDGEESTEEKIGRSKVKSTVENIMALNIAVDKTAQLKKKKKKHNEKLCSKTTERSYIVNELFV